MHRRAGIQKEAERRHGPRISSALRRIGGTLPLRQRTGNYRAPKIAEPTRTCVAPNWMAIAKSALMPIDRCFKPLRAAIFAVSAKCGAGASLTGGMHIRPEIAKPYFSRQAAM